MQDSVVPFSASPSPRLWRSQCGGFASESLPPRVRFIAQARSAEREGPTAPWLRQACERHTCAQHRGSYSALVAGMMASAMHDRSRRRRRQCVGTSCGASVSRHAALVRRAASVDSEVEEDLGSDVAAWLRELDLAHLQDAVMEWCEEMGAETFEEVIESVDELVNSLSAASPEERKRLQAEATAAFEGMTKARMAANVFVFGFEGVICDSIREKTMIAWGHARKLWPKLPLGKNPSEFLGPLRRMTPTVENDWEHTLLIRLVAEALDNDKELTPSKEGEGAGRPGFIGGFANFAGMKADEYHGQVAYTVDWVLNDWTPVRQECLQKWDLDGESLAQRTAELRKNWSTNNRAQWLLEQKPVEAVIDCMEAMLRRGASVFVLTSGDKSLCEDLLNDYGLEVPSENILSVSEVGSSVEVLRTVVSGLDVQETSVHYIDDAFGAMKELASDKSLDDVKLHLASWGYNTTRDQKIAASPLYRTDVVGLDELRQLGSNGDPWA